MAAAFELCRRDLNTLEDAVKTLVVRPARGLPTVPAAVGRVRVRDAVALAEVLKLAKSEAVRRDTAAVTVDNERAVEELVSAASLLLLLEAALLPALLKDCFSEPLVAAMNQVCIALQGRAKVVGGSFDTNAGALFDAMGWYYYHCSSSHMDPELMRGTVERLIVRVTNLLDATVTIAN